jgi:hypothetical protein
MYTTISTNSAASITAKPFADLENLSRVSEGAHAPDKDGSFSQQLRQGLSKPASLP